jgi:(1->4)-alpha-D-glucan 1-alpha-D-glucosylmutase
VKATAAVTRNAGAIIPRATYRLQLHRDFGFDAALRIVPYLARLGISHVYCSPILRARPGSSHGYDIVAYDQINPELGGRDGFDRFSAALREHSMGLLLDIVPNHMGVLGADNAWWMDVLENGMSSLYAGYFDIDWRPPNPQLTGKVLVPVLGGYYGDVLDAAELVLCFERDAGALAIRYHEHRFPLDPGTYPLLLTRAAVLASGDEARATLSALTVAFSQLPGREHLDARSIVDRARDKELHKRSLARFAAGYPAIGDAIDVAVAGFNAHDKRDDLHELLETQVYRLAHWRVAADEINYRRFFDINDLAALRMENEAVFEATHGFVLDLAASGAIDGFRIDHPDGLRDPEQYFRRLQDAYARRAGIAARQSTAPTTALPLYVVVEKIAAPHESLASTWQCHGTTGYDFANEVNGVLIDAAARNRFERIWRNFVHTEEPVAEVVYRGKRAIIQSTLAAERTRLGNELLRIAQGDRHTRDYTFNTLRDALVEIVACLPVYRTYVSERASKQDQRYIDWAVAQARRRSRHIDASVFDFVRRMLLAQTAPDAPQALREQTRNFAMRFQQFSAPVAAKGVEDTAFYRYYPLASLNEVGGDPGVFGLTVRAFHKAVKGRSVHWSHAMLATSTHDNKRAEDVRCRIDVLSEVPGVWRLLLRRWNAMNQRHRVTLDSGLAPTLADEYLLYQTLIGTCPTGALDQTALDTWRQRIEDYMLKAAHEAKLRTSWTNPNPEYEAALSAFVGALLKQVEPNIFLDDLRRQAETFAWFGALNSLSMALIKFTSPGVPDIYQGNELMDLSLVDPDNRRPVDYALRESQLNALTAMASTLDLAVNALSLARSPHDGRAKLWLSWRLLDFRRRHTTLFCAGDYLPLRTHGAGGKHLIAYTRQHENTTLLVIAPRLFARLLREAGKLPVGQELWADSAVETALPDGTQLKNIVTGEMLVVAAGHIMVGEALASFPVAALVVVQLKLD